MNKLVFRKTTPFGLWLASNIFSAGMSVEDMAKAVHVTRQTVSAHMYGRTKVSYMAVCAYCHVLGCGDNPDEIWKLVVED